MQDRIMYIEFKGGNLNGPARIGRGSFSATGKTLRYAGKSFQSLKGGCKANYFDVETEERVLDLRVQEGRRRYAVPGHRRD